MTIYVGSCKLSRVRSGPKKLIPTDSNGSRLRHQKSGSGASGATTVFACSNFQEGQSFLTLEASFHPYIYPILSLELVEGGLGRAMTVFIMGKDHQNLSNWVYKFFREFGTHIMRYIH